MGTWSGANLPSRVQFGPRRLLTLSLIAALMFGLLAGCSSSSNTASPSASGTTPGKKLKVGVITATPIDQGTYDPAHYKAYKAVADRLGWDLKVAEAIPYGEGEQTLTRFAEDGMDVIISTDQGFEQAFLNVAAKYPNIKFIMASDLSDTRLPNVTAYVFNTYEMGCLAGAADALLSKSHIIGGLSGLPIPAALQAFGGAKYCADKVVPGTTLKIAYVNSFTDAALGNEVASSVFSQGADAIFGILGGTVPGVTTAAKAANGKYVGWLVDESSFGPDVVATSILFNFDKEWQEIADAITSNKIEPKVHRLGIADGAITVAPFRLGLSDLDKPMTDLVDSIKNGTVTVPETPVPAP
jgi:basic membrane protein A